MSIIFKRPMFRKGGSTSGMTGIMSGITDRQNYEEAGPARVGELTKQNLDLLMQNAPEDKGFDPLTTFLLQLGPSIVSAKPTGSTIGTILGASEKPIESLLTEQAERRKYLRDLQSGAAQLAIEQAGKEKLLEKELEGRERIEAIKTGGKMSPEYASIFETEMKNYEYPYLAERVTNFKTQKANELYSKVQNRAGGVLTFDISDPEQFKNQKKTLRQFNSKFVYDPFKDNYKLIKFEKGDKVPEIIEYNTIDEIRLEDLNKIKKTTDDEKIVLGEKSKQLQETLSGGEGLTETDKKILEFIRKNKEAREKGLELQKPYNYR